MTPETLTYRFHKFRPSDREEIRRTLFEGGNIDVFVSALGIFLRKWAEADWLADYDIERVAAWCAIHLNEDVRKEIAKMIDTELSASQTEQAKRVYATYKDEFRKNASAFEPAAATGQANLL